MFFKGQKEVTVKEVDKSIFHTWCVEFTDGTIIDFYLDKNGEVSPLERIDDFDRGDYWSIDCTHLKDIAKEKGFNEDPDDDSFYLVPKNQVKRVFCK